jgi:SsrA-binding protein
MVFKRDAQYCIIMDMKTLIENRKANFEYTITDRLTAGVVLSGSEVKSLKSGQGSLAGSFVNIRGGEAYLTNMHISPYKYAADNKTYNPERDRKLLLNHKEISSLVGKEKGTVIVPMQISQTDNGLIKVVLGIGRGKKKYDKRETIKKRDIDRDLRKNI